MSDDNTNPDGIEQRVAAVRAAASESLWLDVIQRMDEVYSDLLYIAGRATKSLRL
jgi:hypothetical protein